MCFDGSVGDHYPYRAQLRIELLSIPSSCWGYNEPRRWTLPQHAGVTYVPIGSTTPAPYTLWPPLPAVPPTAPAIADVYFTPTRKRRTAKRGTENGEEGEGELGPDVLGRTIEKEDSGDDDPLKVQIRWIGDASYCIEAGRELQVRIIPVAVVPCEAMHKNQASIVQNSMQKEEGQQKEPKNVYRGIKSDDGGDDEVLHGDKYQHSLHNSSFPFSDTGVSSSSVPSDRLPSLFPLPVGEQPSWLPESLQLHKRLQAAQWRLVDRAIHLICQAQVSSRSSSVTPSLHSPIPLQRYTLTVAILLLLSCNSFFLIAF